jgi:hypothetical protein
MAIYNDDKLFAINFSAEIISQTEKERLTKRMGVNITKYGELSRCSF